jgi:ADP-ribose pyrophosphatase
MSSRFERVASDLVYAGDFIEVRRERFRHEDGDEVSRDAVTHPGAVGIVALDDERNLWLVRQPREILGVPDLLEIPAGKLDVEGESPLEAGKRELAEEIGKQAEHWEPLPAFYPSPGLTDEKVHLFLATGITDVKERPAAEENERIDIEVRPLADLDALIAEVEDAKTLIGLLLLRLRV